MLQKFMDKFSKDDADSTHFTFSLIKSGLRIMAGGFLIVGFFASAGLLFIVAEVFGIIEEL